MNGLEMNVGIISVSLSVVSSYLAFRAATIAIKNVLTSLRALGVEDDNWRKFVLLY